MDPKLTEQEKGPLFHISKKAPQWFTVKDSNETENENTQNLSNYYINKFGYLIRKLN